MRGGGEGGDDERRDAAATRRRPGLPGDGHDCGGREVISEKVNVLSVEGSPERKDAKGDVGAEESKECN